MTPIKEAFWEDCFNSSYLEGLLNPWPSLRKASALCFLFIKRVRKRNVLPFHDNLIWQFVYPVMDIIILYRNTKKKLCYYGFRLGVNKIGT
jgi:hypothetical protein